MGLEEIWVDCVAAARSLKALLGTELDHLGSWSLTVVCIRRAEGRLQSPRRLARPAPEEVTACYIVADFCVCLTLLSKSDSTKSQFYFYEPGI